MPDKIQSCKVKYIRRRQFYLEIPLDGSELSTVTQKRDLNRMIRQVNTNINPQFIPISQELSAILDLPPLKQYKYRKGLQAQLRYEWLVKEEQQLTVLPEETVMTNTGYDRGLQNYKWAGECE